jgi:hypothetical protein
MQAIASNQNLKAAVQRVLVARANVKTDAGKPLSLS